MRVDHDRVGERLRYIREQVALLQPLALDADLRARRMGDPLTFGGIVRALQTAVEAMIDIAFHLCAKRYAREPQHAVHAFEILAELGDVPEAFLPRVRRMVRFFYLVVHGYLRVEPGLVEDIMAHDLADFATWERIVGAATRGTGAPAT